MDFEPFETAGFVLDEQAKTDLESYATANALSANGPYIVLGVLRKGSVTLTFEQNTSQEPSNSGMTFSVVHAPVCTISSLSSRTACDASNPDLILRVAGSVV